MSEKSTDYFMIKDIEKFIGISSNQLRDYDAKGVLSPTTYKNKEAVHNKGAWLYDDEAVKKAYEVSAKLKEKLMIEVSKIAESKIFCISNSLDIKSNLADFDLIFR